MIEEAKRVAKIRIAEGAEIEGWEVIERAGKRSWEAHAGELIRILESNDLNPLPVVELISPAEMEKRFPEVYRLLREWVSQAEPSLVLQTTSAKRSTRRATAALAPPSDVPKSIGESP
jgi:hypothetical protein